jgi:Integrase zinc binding domain
MGNRDTPSPVTCAVIVSGQPSYTSVEIAELIDRVHNAYVGHVGSGQMCRELKAQQYSWSGVNKDAELFVKACWVG